MKEILGRRRDKIKKTEILGRRRVIKLKDRNIREETC